MSAYFTGGVGLEIPQPVGLLLLLMCDLLTVFCCLNEPDCLILVFFQ